MKKILLLLSLTLFIVSCGSDDDNGDDQQSYEFPYGTTLKGEITYPDNIVRPMEISFKEDRTFFFQASTKTLGKEQKRLKWIEGTYNLEIDSKGVYRVTFNDKALIKEGYNDIVELGENVDNLRSIFPSIYILSRTGSKVTLKNVDNTGGYKIVKN